MVEEALAASDLLSRRAEKHRKPIPRPSSQSAPASPKRRRNATPNHVAQNTADPHVISSIISSFEDVACPTSPLSPPLFSRSSQHSSINDGSTLSRASSRRAPSMPLPILRRSESLGVDYSAYKTRIEKEHNDSVYKTDLEEGFDDDATVEDDDDEAAAFPVVPTSRRSSVRVSHTTPSSPSASLRGYFRSVSRNSRSSMSLSGLSLGAFSPGASSPGALSPPAPDNSKSILSRSSSRLSCESWIRRSASSQRSMDTRPDPPTRKSSRQISRETLKPKSIREERVAALVIDTTRTASVEKKPDSPAQPETPTFARTSPAGRLYLDGTIHESELSGEPVFDFDDDELSARTQMSTPKSASPTKNPITDAIPLRVSSLNRTPSPRHTKPKSSKLDKGKRTQAPLLEGAARRENVGSPEHTAQNPFEGLDEQDTTVKRIRELKQKKEDRLKNESRTSNDMLPSSSSSRSTDAKPPATSRSDRQKPNPKSEHRTTAREPDVRKAHRILGFSGPLSSEPTAYRENHVASSESNKQRDLDSGHPKIPRSVPTEALFDSNPSPESDHALQQREVTKRRLLNGLDLEAPEVTPPSTSQSSRSRLSRSNSDSLERWSHSGLSTQTDSSNKVRRKSMSDARNEQRILEQEMLEERRNSVNFAVEEYLSAPRLNQKIRNAQDGRLISFSEVGDPVGAAVIVCVGMGLTRFVTAFYDELAATLGLRLITLDRPGVGESEPYSERSIGPLSWPDDVVAVTQHLKISQFSLLAHSAGAIYALATALILPQCVRGRVQLLAPWIPPSQFDTYGIKDRSPDATPVASLPRSQRFLRVLPIPFLKAANGGLFSPSSLKPASVRNSPNSSPSAGLREGPRNAKNKRRPDPLRRESMMLMDQVVPEKPVYTMFPLPELAEEDASGLQSIRRPSVNLTATASPMDPEWTYVAEALDAAEHSSRERRAAYSALLTERTWMLATRNSNPAVDLLVCLERHRDIGFRYVDIQRPMVMTSGSEDKRVPAENIKWIGEQINRRAAMNWRPDAKQDFKERGLCEVRVLPGEGHGLMASAGVMADVLSEIAREWIGSKW